MTTAVADFEDERDDEGAGDEGADDADASFQDAYDADRRDRKWFAELRAFVNERLPAASEGAYAVVRETSPAVAEAEDRAVVAALRAIEKIASRFVPPKLFTLDARFAGRDH